MRKSILLAAVLTLASLDDRVAAQRPRLADDVKAFVSVDAPLIALTNAGVIDVPAPHRSPMRPS